MFWARIGKERLAAGVSITREVQAAYIRGLTTELQERSRLKRPASTTSWGARATGTSSKGEYHVQSSAGGRAQAGTSTGQARESSRASPARQLLRLNFGAIVDSASQSSDPNLSPLEDGVNSHGDTRDYDCVTITGASTHDSIADATRRSEEASKTAGSIRSSLHRALDNVRMTCVRATETRRSDDAVARARLRLKLGLQVPGEDLSELVVRERGKEHRA